MPEPSPAPDPSAVAALRWIEIVALSVASIIALSALLVWFTPALAALAPAGLHAMRPVTAGWVLIAVAALSLSRPNASRSARRVAAALACLLVVMPFGVLLTYAGVIPYPASLPSRPWAHTIIAWLLASPMVPFVAARSGWRAWAADIGAICAVAFALLVFGSFAFGVVEFTTVGNVSYTAPQVLACLVLIVLVVVGRRAEAGGLFAPLLAGGRGTRLVRTLLPYLLLAPFVLFATQRKLAEIGLVSTAQAMAIAVPVLVLGVAATVFGIARSTSRVEEELRHQSLTDALTGVLNRRGFDTVADYVVRVARRNGTPITAFFFDLDDLKGVNDAYGHNVGSLLIRRFAELLVATFRASDLVARVGGDEFVVLASAPTTSLAVLAERLQAAVAETNASGVLPTAISYSVGYSELLPGSATDLDQLISDADARMYAAKTNKRAA